MDAKEFLLDCRGKACPRPVIETKKALADKGAVCTLVDNEIAVQNLQKMAAHVGAASEVEKRGDDFAVHVTPGAAPAAAADEQALPAAPAGKTVVAVTSGQMGQGDDKLGGILIKGFLFALTQLDTLPDTLVFYNAGAFLTCEGSPCLEDLKTLEEAGCEILTCGTCLDFYHLKEKLAVGGVTNLYDIAQRLTTAARVVRP